MNRVFKYLFVMMVMLGIGAAQAEAQTIGFKVGPTFSKLSTDDSETETETLTSFGGGGFIRFGFAGLSLQTEVLALTKGAKQSFTDEEIGDVTSELKLNYVEIPVTAMFSLGAGPYLFAGPSVSFETSCTINFESDIINVDDTDCDDSDEELSRKKTELSLVGGAGFEIPLGPGRLLLEGRYHHGLTNLSDDEGEDSGSAKHRTWAVFAGFAIPIGR